MVESLAACILFNLILIFGGEDAFNVENDIMLLTIKKEVYMARLIPEYTWTDFLKVQKAGRLKELKSGEVTFNGEYLFTFVNGNTDSSGFLRTISEGRCQSANAVGGKTLEEILGSVLA